MKNGQQVNGVTCKDGESSAPFAFRRIFAYGSLQFCGHMEEYLVARTRELSVFIVQPRHGEHTNLLRRYRDGVLVGEHILRSSQNVLMYYVLWYVHHVRELLRFCPKGEKTLVFGGHPIVFFGMGFFRLLRPLAFAYWIGDYFPSRHPVIRLYERVKKGCQRRADYAYYLTDAINRVMNDGALADTLRRRTVMWGLKPFPPVSSPPPPPFTLLFVGLIRPGQGLEALFDFLAAHPDCRLSLIGVGLPDYVAGLQWRVQQLGLGDRVFFPNRFYSEAELVEVSHACHVGVALYDRSEENFTHYADPGKVKAYAEMGLPILMTRISDIAPFVERFGCGEVIDGPEHIGDALERLCRTYPSYRSGVARFVAHFAFEAYYDRSFEALKELWK